ncbi:MAG TPA: hypothetical protein VF310_16275 [Vicinamibacteria bacterium]
MAGAEAIGLILLAWASGTAIFLGLGRLVLPPATRDAGGPFRALWAGFAALLAFLQLWHLVWPVDGAALAVLAALAAAGLARGRAPLAWPGREALWPSLLLLAALLLVADRSLGPPLANDSGGYHLGSVRWAAEHPAVPGLANLDLRLGFASSFFLYVALLDVGPLEQRSHHVAGGLLLALLLAQLLVQAARSPRGRAADLAAALMIPPALSQALGWNVSSPTPDLAVFVLGTVLGLRLLEHVEDRGSPVLELVALAAALVTVKLSALALAGAAVVVALALSPRPDRRPLAAAAVAGAFLLPWMATNVVLSGYPAYPLQALAAPVGWRVPEAEVARLQEWIRSWARAPGLRPEQVLGRGDWIAPWARTLLGNRIWVQVPLLLLAVGAVGLAVRRRAALWPALFPPLAAIAYWLALAPDLRFLGAALWLLAAFAIAMVWRGEGARGAALLPAALGALLALGVLAGAWRRHDLLLRPDPVAGFHPTPPAPVAPRTLSSGLVVQVPPARSCFDAPLPCAADPPPDLRPRRAGDLRAGFVRSP